MAEGLEFTEDEIEIETERLRLFAEGLLEVGLVYEIRPVPPAATGSIWATPDRFAEAVPHLLEWNRAGVNPYFSVNPRREVGERTGEGSLPGSLLVADFDDGRPLEQVRARIAAEGLPVPTAIVQTSPDHWHCYWRLEERLPDLATFKRHQRGLVEKLDSCPAVCSFQQVMRCPGPFCNVKPDRPAKPRVQIVDCDPNRIYSADAFPMADAEPVYQAVPLEQLAMKIEAGSMADATRELVEQLTVMPGKGRRQSIYQAARDLHARAWSLEDATAVLVAVAGRLGLEPDDVEDIPRQVKRAFATPATPGFAVAETARIICTSSPTPAAAAAGDDDGDDYNAELEAIPLPQPPAMPPRPAVALAHGVIGTFLQRVEHETEAHPVALAGTLLAAIGNCIGRGPHAIVGRTYHYTNLFVAIVGNTGTGRKGTGGDIVTDCMKPADPEWAKWCQSPNLVSGEGVIEALRDPVVKMIAKKGGGPDDFEATTVDPGVVDKRLLITSSELASALKAANRENSILSQTLREAWDGKTLRTMAKNCARTATDPHLSIVGHVTRQELVKVARESDIFGGTYNRFLFLLSDRARLLPHGGDLDDLGTVPARITDVIAFARDVGRVQRSAAADRLWESVYGELTTPVGSELLAAVLSRGEAQTLRLSLLLALAAGRATIEADDLAAAIDLWRYAVASAETIFGGVNDSLAQKVLELITANPGITRTRLHKRAGWRLPSTELVNILGRLRSSGQARMELVQTSGKTAEAWYPASRSPWGDGGVRGVWGEKPPEAEAKRPKHPKSPTAPEAATTWDPDNLKPGRYAL